VRATRFWNNLLSDTFKIEIFGKPNELKLWEHFSTTFILAPKYSRKMIASVVER
jgi:hypothetical protein